MKPNLSIWVFIALMYSLTLQSQIMEKHRAIVLTDIEADPDDTESLVRLLLYSSQIDIKAIIATTSVWQKNRVAPESIHKVIDAYAKVRGNLLKHEAGYPEASYLKKMVFQGLPLYGMEGVGEGHDSPGSERIIKVLEDDDPRPLYISVWGGVNTLAQSLYKINKTRSESEKKRLLAKIRVYTISDQDDSGVWIRNKFQDLFYIVSPGDDYASSTWVGINKFVKGIDNTTISNAWLQRNIQQGHGPLGACYPDVAYGMEGDTPSWLSLIPNGLHNPEHPEWGGWGGRYELYKPDFTKLKKGPSDVPIPHDTRKIWADASDTYSPYLQNDFGRTVKQDSLKFSDNQVSLWRWRDDFQNDFAARMDWCLSDYKQANHAPVINLNQKTTISVKSGKRFTLGAVDSSDPDGDHINYLWQYYPEAGTYKKPIKIDGAENMHVLNAVAPDVAKTETIHIILKVSDDGSPQMTSYSRIIIEVLP